jgi:SAM-dependent methyltransferase
VDTTLRKPFQGVINIIRFNWPFYVAAAIALVALCILSFFLTTPFHYVAVLFSFLIVLSTLISLVVSFYIYDTTDLYDLPFMKEIILTENATIVNINAGFDETSDALQQKYPKSKLLVYDFYDPKKHTEASIERARKAYPAYPNTISINTDSIPLENNSVDIVILIFALHEVRNNEERIQFLQLLHQKIKPNGTILIVEHQRDFINFFAYNFGFLHFHSTRTWLTNFKAANLSLSTHRKFTPFISIFTLQKNGATT